MDGSALCKTLTFSQLEGSRRKGRPKLMWLEDAWHGLKTIKVAELGGRRHEQGRNLKGSDDGV
jgi:hypothetical protein